MWATLYLRQAIGSTHLRRAFASAFRVDVSDVRLFGVDLVVGKDAIRLMVTDEKPPAFPVEIIVSLNDRVAPGSVQEAVERLGSLARSLGTAILVDLSADERYRYADPSGVVIGVTVDDARLDSANELELSEESQTELAKAIAAAA